MGKLTRGVVVFVSIAMTACGAHAREAVRDDYRARVERLRSETDNNYIWPSCPPPAQYSHIGKCGLVFDRWFAEESAKHFFAQRCRRDDGAPFEKDVCWSLFMNGFLDELSKRYSKTAETDVATACREAAPETCKTAFQIELMYLKLHNRALLDDERMQLRQIAREYDDAQADATEQDERGSRILRAVAGALEQMASTPQTQNTAYVPPTPVQGPTLLQPPPSSTSGCSSDIECGGPGYVCSKPAGSYRGQCARAVNSYGNQDFSRTPSPNIGPGRVQCTMTSGCPIGFRCDAGRCMR